MSSEPSPDRSGSGPDSSLPTSDRVDETLLAMQDVLGRKWHPPLVYHLLADGPMGFSDLQAAVDGISSKMLAESLDALESSGIVARRVLSERPVRVEYDLTERGAALDGVVGAMVEWGLAHEIGEDVPGRSTEGARGATAERSPDAPERE